MNYISAINSFWDSATVNPLSTGQVSLYFALLHINNKSNWTEWFQAPNQVLSILTGMSRSGISKARNELRQRGLVEFRERGTKATLYHITIANSVQDSVQDGVQNSTQNSVQDGVQNSSTLYKYKQKQEETKKKDTNVSKEKRFTPPSVDEVAAYCREQGNGINAQAFVDFYASKGWMVGSNRMKDWQAAVRTWERNEKNAGRSSAGQRGRTGGSPASNRFHNFEQSATDYDALAMQRIRDRMSGEEEGHEGT